MLFWGRTAEGGEGRDYSNGVAGSLGGLPGLATPAGSIISHVNPETQSPTLLNEPGTVGPGGPLCGTEGQGEGWSDIR